MELTKSNFENKQKFEFHDIHTSSLIPNERNRGD